VEAGFPRNDCGGDILERREITLPDFHLGGSAFRQASLLRIDFFLELLNEFLLLLLQPVHQAAGRLRLGLLLGCHLLDGRQLHQRRHPDRRQRILQLGEFLGHPLDQ